MRKGGVVWLVVGFVGRRIICRGVVRRWRRIRGWMGGIVLRRL
jgi:hypothetical protein